MKIFTLPDITIAATGVAQPVLTPGQHQNCKWFQINGVTVDADARVGDSTTTAARGIPLSAGGGTFSPPIAEPLNHYDLADVFLVGTQNDVLAVNYAV